jgi:uncharacterized protein
MGHAVVHFGIGAVDDEAVSAFYRDVFGWDTLAFPSGGGTAFNTRGGDGIIGSVGLSDAAFYVETDDLLATCDRAVSLGATSVVPLAAVVGPPLFATFKDPDGLAIGLVQSWGGELPGPSAGDGAPVTWFEIMGTDAVRTQRFYAELFGWTVDNSAYRDYAVVDTGTERGIQGGIGGGQAVRWAIVYARVADADQTMNLAGQLGATPATDRALSDLKAAARAARYGEADDSMKMAELRDPAGNIFGIFSY